jgi:hypothetical protein
VGRVQKRADADGREVGVAVRRHLDAAYDSLRAAALIEQNLPFAVCPRCKGLLRPAEVRPGRLGQLLLGGPGGRAPLSADAAASAGPS